MRRFWLCLLIGGVVGCSEDTPRTVYIAFQKVLNARPTTPAKQVKMVWALALQWGSSQSNRGQDSMAGSITPWKVA